MRVERSSASTGGTTVAAVDLVLRGRALVDGALVDAEVGVAGGRVADVRTGSTGVLVGRETVHLAPDEVLLPGLVDTHVHVNEPGRTHWEGFASATAAAAAGGVTTIVDMPLNSIPPTTTPANLAAKLQAADGAVHVDVAFWGGAVPENLGRLRELHECGVMGFKAFLAPSGVPEFGHLDGPRLEAALAEIASFDGLLLVHAEDAGVLHAHEHHGGRAYADYLASRPDEAEVVAIEALVDGVRRTGARAHVLHLSSAAALPVLRAARAEGLPITVETCPHYLVLDAAAIDDGATQFKCAPPIRDDANRDALWQALLDGDVDLVVSDHSPSTRELKLAGGGDFAQAWGGIAGLQVGLAAVWTEAARRGVPLEQVVRWMATSTADLVGLARKGRIEVGADADLVVFAPDEPVLVRAGELLHKNAVSAFDGARLHGRVRRSWLRGVPVEPGGPAGGRLLQRPG